MTSLRRAAAGDVASVTEPASSPEPSSPAPAKSGYPPVAALPTQAGPQGLRFDFNLGARVQVPAGDWRVRLSDLDTGNVLFEIQAAPEGSLVASAKRYYVRFRIEAWQDGGQVLLHDFDASGKEVLIAFPIGTLGDVVAWFPYAVRFQERHGCRVTCAMSALIIPLFRDAYPAIQFVPHEAVEPERFYATYRVGLFFDDADGVWQPSDFRLVGLHRTAGYIVGVDPGESRPVLALPDESRPIAEPYVCIAVQSSSQCKYWNNPAGWHEVVTCLKQAGYRVVCIDQKPVHGQGLMGRRSRTARRTRRATVRWSSGRAGSGTLPPLSACRAASRGSPGRPAARS